METFEVKPKRPIPWKIYLAHSLSTWGDNMWWFAGGLYMMKLAPENLRLTAMYGLIIAASVICFGASVGNWIDKTRRITAARTFLAIQNFCVSLCAIGVSFFLWIYACELDKSTVSKDEKYLSGEDVNGESEMIVTDDLSKGTNPNHQTQLMSIPSLETAKLATIVGVITFSSIARLASSGTVIILQKDWIVVISENDTDYLAKMNSILRTIELTTYMLAPVISGQLFYFIGYIWTGIFIAGWNILSVICEYALLNGIYTQYPRLAQKITNANDSEKEAMCEEGCRLTKADMDKKGNESKAVADEKEPSIWEKFVPKAVRESFVGWQTYFDHPVRNAGLGLALLYMTVLGFDNITYGYAIIQKVPESVLGILVALSAVVGVLGSVTYPLLKKRLGLERTGLLGMFLLVGTSTLSVLSIFIPGSPFITWMTNVEKDDEDLPSNIAHVTVLMAGIILARFGLWIVDLTITQILQERVEEERRGVVNGVQDSLNNSMDLLKCVLVILLPDAKHFGCLIILSYISISSGWLLYAAFSRQQRGHLFHFCRLIPCSNQNELPATSHWPFLPEPENKQPAYDCEEDEAFRIEDTQEIENCSPIIKSSVDVEKLEKIICCNA